MASKHKYLAHLLLKFFIFFVFFKKLLLINFVIWLSIWISKSVSYRCFAAGDENIILNPKFEDGLNNWSGRGCKIVLHDSMGDGKIVFSRRLKGKCSESLLMMLLLLFGYLVTMSVILMCEWPCGCKHQTFVNSIKTLPS